MNLLKIIAVTGFIVLISSPGNSQETEQLTLKKSIQTAIANSKTLDKTLNSIEIQSSIIKTKYGSLIPSLSFSSGWQRTNQINSGTGYNINGINVVTGGRDTTTDNFNMSLRSDVLLFNGFANYDAIDLARMNKQTYFYQLETQRQDLVLKVISDYITILKNQQILKINIATLEDSKSQLEKIKIFVEVGKKTMSDIYNQDADVAQKELAVEQSKNNVDKSVSDLV